MGQTATIVGKRCAWVLVAASGQPLTVNSGLSKKIVNNESQSLDDRDYLLFLLLFSAACDTSMLTCTDLTITQRKVNTRCPYLSNMPRVQSIKTLTDQDGDVIMSDTSILPLNPFKDKFNFDWFSFDGKTASPKSPTYSPASPNSTRKLSVSTASPSSYFTSSPLSTDSSSRNATDLDSTTPPKVIYPPPPAKPLRWVWQCHLCHSRYPLSVTRRCLVDGHYYCSGNSPAQRNMKKRRKQQSCTSEFDYVAWKEWGQWRRKTLALRALANGNAEPKLTGCDGCSSPSQCRYDKRKPVEVVKFDDFVDGGDLVIDVDESVASGKAASEASFQSSEHGSISPLKEEKGTRGKKPAVKKTLRIDSNQLSPSLNQKSSKRHRFYSGLSGNLSTRDSSPTFESSSSFNQGRFDPTLPSVSKSFTSEDDLNIIESTLKAALANQAHDSSKKDVIQSTIESKRCVNSKVSDPQFEVTPEDLQSGRKIEDGTLGLYRTKSQQSLLTDFFRQSRGPISGDPIKTDVGRAASEADIAAFLQSKPAHQLDELNSRMQKHHSLRTSNDQHFEDINLSPTAASSHKDSTPSAEIAHVINDQTEGSKNVQPDNGSESGRTAISFGFPNFVFGRK